MADDKDRDRAINALATAGLQPNDPFNLSDPFNALAGLLVQNTYTYKNQWFFKQELTLDGYAFENCKFEACTLYVLKGTFKLTDCAFEKCQIYYGGEALKVVKVFQANLPVDRRSGGPSLLPTTDVHGRITIE